MDTKATVTQIVLNALIALNKELPEDQQVPVKLDTALFGNDAVLDSLSLVSVIVDVEGEVSATFSKHVALTDDEAMSQSISPFLSANSLVQYITNKLDKE